MHRFGLEHQMLPDYEVVSWYLCTHPTSVFIKDLMVARSIQGGRYTLFNNQFTVHKKNEGSTKKKLDTAEEVMDVLKVKMLINLPEGGKLKDKVQRLLEEIQNS